MKKQAAEAEESAAQAAVEAGTEYSSVPATAEGSLASDEALQALRDKLTGGLG